MNSQDLQKKNLPDLPGVYEFLDGKRQVLYVGKATSLKDRVKSYFDADLIETRGRRIVDMVALAEDMRVTPLLSVLEALILEAKKIQELDPKYNALQKDNKSFNHVVITKEDFPKIFTIRGRTLEAAYPKEKIKYSFGPFTSGSQLKEAMKIIRKIFPYRDQKCVLNIGKPCFNYQIGLCPGTCIGAISKKEYAKTIRHIKLFFEGKKTELVRLLEKEMHAYSKELRFEEAQKVKKTIFALDHINDIALIKRESWNPYANYESRRTHSDGLSANNLHTGSGDSSRIEAYDIAHISGTNTVGVMTVVEDGELNKNEYRKFKIRGAKRGEVNDVKNLKEVLVRRLGHAEWTLPNIIVVDGNVAQINAAKEVLEEKGFNIDIIAVVKDSKHKAHELLGEKSLIENHGSACMLANSEAHRFAIQYHRLLRRKMFER